MAQQKKRKPTKKIKRESVQTAVPFPDAIQYVFETMSTYYLQEMIFFSKVPDFAGALKRWAFEGIGLVVFGRRLGDVIVHMLLKRDAICSKSRICRGFGRRS